MDDIQTLKLKTNCAQCVQKCCSQPYDWVYLTHREVDRLKDASGLAESDFVTERRNSATEHVFQTLNLPCRFFEKGTGRCAVYEARPLICQIFPFYPEPLTGDVTLLPVQCGTNLELLPPDAPHGWRVIDFEADLREWLKEFWTEASARKPARP